MYSIYCDGQLLYAPNMSETLPIDNAVLSQELNRADSLKFRIYPQHPLYNDMKLMLSDLVVFDGEEPISILRPISYTRDFSNIKEYTCEGVLGYFNDSIVEEYDYAGTVKGYFARLINSHNAQVGASRKVGSYSYDDGTDDDTGFDDNNYIVRANNSYPTTWDEIQDKLLNLLGGYILPSYERATDSGGHIIEGRANFSNIKYAIESGEHGEQVISSGRNLLDFSENVDRSEKFTRIVPLGTIDAEEGTTPTKSHLTIEDAIVDGHRYGKIYIDADNNYINQYGIITLVRSWDDVTVANNLYTKARQFLNKNVQLNPVSMTVKAADLSYLTENEKRFKIGQINRVVSVPHGIDEDFRCSALQIRFDNLQQNVYTFGEVKGTLTRML